MSGTSEPSVMPTTARALLRRVAQEQATARAPALVAGVTRDGTLVWSGSRGQVDHGRPDTDTQFRIGSITKTFTAVLVLRLRDEGRLDLADPLEKHVPDTPLGGCAIAQLLSHTAGLQAELDGPWWERTPGSDWAHLAKTFAPSTLRHRPGERFHYSNLGFAVLGEVVARLRGKPWWDALRAEVLEPLDLGRTTYHPVAPHASGFAVHPWADVVLPEPAHDAGAMAPAGQLWSTVADLARWAAFIGGDTDGVLSPDTVAEMREMLTVDRSPEWVSGYGLGLQILRSQGRTLVGHGGSMPGFLAELFVDVEEKVGAVALANTTAGMSSLTSDLIRTVVEAEPRLPEEWSPASHVPADVLEIVGPWYWGPRAFLLRARGERELELQPVDGRTTRASRFRPQDDGTWMGLDGYYAGETLRVVRRDDGSVSHLDLATFVFTREPYDPKAPIPGGVDPDGWSGSTT